MTTKLATYNGALRLLKERRLSSVTENREPRRLLDDAWGNETTEGAVPACLEMGQWTFATRSVQIDYSPSVNPSFGYTYAFNQPTDMTTVCGIYSDPRMEVPLLDYRDERRFWYTDLQTIYVAYVSKDSGYGADLSLWPDSFRQLVEAYLAREIAGNLTNGDEKVKMATAAFEKALTFARSKDAMRKPPAFMPPSDWVTSRQGNLRSRWNGSWS